MFRRTKCPSAGRLVRAALCYYIMHLYKYSGRCQVVFDMHTIKLCVQSFLKMNTWLSETYQRQCNWIKSLIKRCVFRWFLLHMHIRMHLSNNVQYSSSVSHSQRLRWSRGSVLAFGTQVRGFKPDRSRWIFQGEKILSTPSFTGEVKPSVPCRRFTVFKRSLNVRWKSGIFQAKFIGHFSSM